MKWLKRIFVCTDEKRESIPKNPIISRATTSSGGTTLDGNQFQKPSLLLKVGQGMSRYFFFTLRPAGLEVNSYINEIS